MTRTVTGNLGLNVALTVSDDATATGTQVLETNVDSAYSSVNFTDATKVVSFSGTIGTGAMTFTLSALNDVTVTTNTMSAINSTDPVAITTIYAIILENNSLNALTMTPGASNSFLTASEQITVKTMAANGFIFPNGQTVTASSNDQFRITASLDASAAKLIIVGN